MTFVWICAKSSFFLGPRPLVLPLVTQSPWSRRHPRHHANGVGIPKFVLAKQNFLQEVFWNYEKIGQITFLTKKFFLLMSFFAIEYFLFLRQIFSSPSKQWNIEWTNMHTNDQSCFISQSCSSSAFGFRESLLRSKGRGILVGEFGFCFRKDRSIWVFESYCRSNSRKWALTWK